MSSTRQNQTATSQKPTPEMLAAMGRTQFAASAGQAKALPPKPALTAGAGPEGSYSLKGEGTPAPIVPVTTPAMRVGAQAFAAGGEVAQQAKAKAPLVDLVGPAARAKTIINEPPTHQVDLQIALANTTNARQQTLIRSTASDYLNNFNKYLDIQKQIDSAIKTAGSVIANPAKYDWTKYAGGYKGYLSNVSQAKDTYAKNEAAWNIYNNDYQAFIKSGEANISKLMTYISKLKNQESVINAYFKTPEWVQHPVTGTAQMGIIEDLTRSDIITPVYKPVLGPGKGVSPTPSGIPVSYQLKTDPSNLTSNQIDQLTAIGFTGVVELRNALDSGLVRKTATGYQITKSQTDLTAKDVSTLNAAGFRVSMPTQQKYKVETVPSPMMQTFNKFIGVANAAIAIQEGINSKLSELESAAKWATPDQRSKGYWKQEPVPLNVVAARLEHLALSAAVGAETAAPYILLSATGPIGGALAGGVIAGSILSIFVNPLNRNIAVSFVENHPEQFTAGLLGAIAAGIAVPKVAGAFSDFREYLTQAQQFKITQALDRQIDDIAFMEQDMGAVFPYNDKEIAVYKTFLDNQARWARAEVYDKFIDDLSYLEQDRALQYDPMNPKLTKLTGADAPSWETFVVEKSLKSVTPEDLAVLDARNYGVMMYMVDSRQLLETPTSELIERFPRLLDPAVSPLTQPEIQRLQELVSQQTSIEGITPYSPKPYLVSLPDGTTVSPLFFTALAIIAKQGYITDSQIMNLIAQNNAVMLDHASALENIQISWNAQALESLTIPQLITLTIAIADVQAIQAQATQQVQLTQQLTVQDVKNVIPLLPDTVIENIIPQFMRDPNFDMNNFLLLLPKPAQEKFKWLLKKGKSVLKYKITLGYRRGRDDLWSGAASNYPDALNKALRGRKRKSDEIVGSELRILS